MIGLFSGGPIGLLVGGFIGYMAGKALQVAAIGGLRVAQTELIETIFSVMGALCKADNVVSRDEIQMAEQAFDMLKLRGEQRDLAKAAFNKGKQTGFDLDSAVDRFAAISRGRGPLVQLFLQLQCMAIALPPTVRFTLQSIRCWFELPAGSASPNGMLPNSNRYCERRPTVQEEVAPQYPHKTDWPMPIPRLV